ACEANTRAGGQGGGRHQVSPWIVVEYLEHPGVAAAYTPRISQPRGDNSVQWTLLWSRDYTGPIECAARRTGVDAPVAGRSRVPARAEAETLPGPDRPRRDHPRPGRG